MIDCIYSVYTGNDTVYTRIIVECKSHNKKMKLWGRLICEADNTRVSTVIDTKSCACFNVVIYVDN